MMTLKEALEHLGNRPDRATLEVYISRSWVRPVKQKQDWRFEDIDIARAKLVHHLHEEIGTPEEAMEITLHLLDQLYGLREQMRRVGKALHRQPPAVRRDILAVLSEAEEEVTDV